MGGHFNGIDGKKEQHVFFTVFFFFYVTDIRIVITPVFNFDKFHYFLLKGTFLFQDSKLVVLRIVSLIVLPVVYSTRRKHSGNVLL